MLSHLINCRLEMEKDSQTNGTNDKTESDTNVKNDETDVSIVSNTDVALRVDSAICKGVSDDVGDTGRHSNVKDDRFWNGIKHWAEYTTFHGIRNIFDEKTSIYRRGCWLVAICVFLVITVWVCQDQLNRYLAYKTLTEMVSHFPRTIPFPAITICSCNQIKNESITDDRERLLLHELFISKQPNTTYLTEQLGTSFLDNASLRSMFKNSAFKEEELLRECYWEGVEINCTQWKKQRTNSGHCFTFNSETEASDFGLKVVRMTGKKYGFQIMLWTNKENYFIHEDSCLGFKVMVHEPWEYPDVDNAITVEPGSTHHVALTRHEYTYLPYPVLAFGDQECFDKSAAPFPDQYKQYTVQYCVEMCRTKYIHDRCGCVGPLDVETRPECDPVSLVECYTVANAEFLGHVDDCYCPMPCKVTEFRTEVTSARFSPTFLLNQKTMVESLNDIDIQNISDNLVEVKIFYADKVIKHHGQVLAVTFEDLWASFGGFLGISVGASIVTFFEILELLIVNGVHHFRFMRNMSRDHRPNIR